MDRTRRTKKRNLVPLNILVVGRGRTGKSTFARTLVASIERENGRWQAQAQAQVPLSLPTTTPLTAYHTTTFNCTTTDSTVANAFEAAGFFAMPPVTVVPADEVEAASRVQLSLVDSPALETEADVNRVVDFIRSHYDTALAEEVKVKRDPRNAYRSMVHAVVYLLDAPARRSEGWRFDVAAMRTLSAVVNVVPVFARSDSLTVRELATSRMLLRAALDFSIFALPFTNNTTLSSNTTAEAISLLDRFPLALFGAEFGPEASMSLGASTEALKEVARSPPLGAISINTNQQSETTVTEITDPDHQNDDNDYDSAIVTVPLVAGPLGRMYPWGMLDVDEHSDMPLLRELLFENGLEYLRDYTREVHYENHRTRRLTSDATTCSSSSSSLLQAPRVIL